jgi:hypothetical protein
MSVFKWADSARRRFFALVDSDELRLFQVIVYLGMALSGFYMLYFGAPTTVNDKLGPLMNAVWVALTMIGPLLVGVGVWMVARGERLVLSEDRCGGGGYIYRGWYAQAGGDMAIMMVCLTYVIAAFSSAWLVRGIFAAFIVSSLAVCASVLVLRDVRRIRAIERL